MTLVDRLREVPCDREPFTPDHAQCICRLANEAAEKIDALEAALTEIRDILPIEQDNYSRRVFTIAANAVEPTVVRA